MKYRAAATQIKEIPIVFRGIVEKRYIEKDVFARIGGADKTGEVVPELGGLYAIPIEIPEMYLSKYIDFIDDPKPLTIEFDGEEYTLPVISAGWGEIGPDGPSFVNYPVLVLAGEASMVFVLDNGLTHSVYFQLPIETVYGGGKKIFSADLTGNGQIKRFHCRFALGENGTLHIKPYVILNGNIRVDLCAFASNGDNYISGDNEEIAFDCFVPVETHAIAYVEAENVGDYDSILDAAMVVQYEDFIEPESIVGYEGINLNRR